MLLAGGIGVGLAAAPNHVQVVQPGLTGQRHTATNAANGVTGTVGLVAKGWGTQVWLDLPACAARRSARPRAFPTGS